MLYRAKFQISSEYRKIQQFNTEVGYVTGNILNLPSWSVLTITGSLAGPFPFTVDANTVIL